jgi:hypothetical protein
MGCPTQCVLGENLTFTIQAVDGSGAVADATGNPAYSVYEDETSTAILSGSLAKLSSQTGFYSEQIECTAANGFERYKSYTIRITATVSGVATGTAYTFICLGVEDTPSATTGALTTTALFKSYAGITHTDDDTLIGYLISRATDAIEKYCDRTLRSASYRQRYDGKGYKELLLDEYPVTAVTSLSTGIADVIRITNTTSDAWHTGIKITSTTMTLSIDGGTNDGSDDLTLSSYTIETLVTAINALGKGWSATTTISDYAVWDADEILPTSGLNCLDRNAYVSVPQKTEQDFIVDEYVGSITLPTGFPSGDQNVTVRYTAGYATTPADLEQICIDLVNTYYRGRKRDMSVKSEKLSDHSITFVDGSFGLPKEIRIRLAPYKKWSR